MVIKQTLAKRMCQTLNMPLPYCSAAINELQAHALDKLKARDTFKDKGKILKKKKNNNFSSKKLNGQTYGEFLVFSL